MQNSFSGFVRVHKQTETEKLVDAFLYSFVVYLIFTLIFGIPTQITRRQLAALLVIPLCVVGAVSYVMTNDSVGHILRKFRITHRTTRPSVWHDVFHKYGGYVLAELGDGRFVFGWVEFYSDFPSPPSLFLNDACWIDRQTGERRQIAGRQSVTEFPSDPEIRTCRVIQRQAETVGR